MRRFLQKKCAAGRKNSLSHGLKFRIFSRLVIVVSLILLILSMALFVVITSVLRFSLESRGKDDIQFLAYLLNDALSNAIAAGKTLAIHPEVQELLKQEYNRDEPEDAFAIRAIINSIEKSVLLQDYVQSFCIVSASHQGYWSISPNSDDFLEWFEGEVLDGSTVEDFRGFTDIYVFPASIHSAKPVRLISYVCPMNVIVSNDRIVTAYLVINLNFDQLITSVKNKTDFFNQIAILNFDRDLIWLSAGEIDEYKEEFAQMTSSFGRNEGNYYFSYRLFSAGWYLLATADISHMYDFMQPSYLLLGFLVIASVIILLGCLYPLLNKITRQIQDLSGAIDQVRQGNLDTVIDLDEAKELKNISDGFNLMTKSIKEHIRKSVEETERSQQLAFELLLAKINPHFIYNTLNSIIYLARKRQHEDIVRMTSAFIWLLQDSIHLGESTLYARVGNELEVIRQYIIIQKYRYRERFDFVLSCDEGLEECYIPRNILQPLVENSLIHGICTDDKKGTIRLEMKKEEDCLIVLLEDDGVGMEQDYACRLLDSSTVKDADRRARVRPIGINNIAERLEYLFHDRHAFYIQSSPGAGTRITIQIPLVSRTETEEPFTEME